MAAMYRNTLADLHNVGEDSVYGFTDLHGTQGTRQFHHWPRFGVEEDILDISLEDLSHKGRRREARYSERRGFTTEERTKRFILCFIVVVVVVLLLVGGIFPAIFLSTQLTAQETAAMTPETEFVGGNVTFDTEFIAAYNDPNSVEYQALAQTFITEMDNLFRNDEGYLQTIVHDITQGSSIIGFESVYTQATNADVTFKEIFRERLEAEAQTGSLGTLVFVPSTLVVFDVCNLYCFNGGTVNRAINVCDCSCPVGFLAPLCEAPTTTMITTQPATTTAQPSTTTMSQTTAILATTAVDEKTALATTAELSTNAMVPTTTVIPITTQLPTTTEIPSTTVQLPTTPQLPNTTKIPTTTELPTTTEIPTTTELPATTEITTTTEFPATTENPTTMELPTTTENPTTMELPTTTENPTTTELPTTTENPTTMELPATTENPTTMELPTTTENPTTMELPTTTEIPTTTELPTTESLMTTELHCHAFKYRYYSFKFLSNDEIVEFWHPDFPYPRFLFCLNYLYGPPLPAGPDGFVCPAHDDLVYLADCLDDHYRIITSRSHCNLTQSTSCPSIEELYRQINNTFGTDEPPAEIALVVLSLTSLFECVAIGDDANRTLPDGFDCPSANVTQEYAECLDYHIGSVVLNGQTITGNASAVCNARPLVCPSIWTFLYMLSDLFLGPGECTCVDRRKRSHGESSSSSLSSSQIFQITFGIKGRSGCYDGFPYPRLLYCLDNPTGDSCPDPDFSDMMWLCVEYHSSDPDYDGEPLSPEDCPCLDDFLATLEAEYGRDEPPDCVCYDRRNFVGNLSGENLSGMPPMDLCGFVLDFPFPLLTLCLTELNSDLLPSSATEPFICPDPEVLDYFDICLYVLFDGSSPPSGWNGSCPCAGDLYQELYETFGYDLPLNFFNETNRGCVCFANESFDGEKFDELEFAMDRYEDCLEDPTTTFNNGAFACPDQVETFDGCFEFYFGNYSAPVGEECLPQAEFIEVFVETLMGDDVPIFDCDDAKTN